LYGNRIHTFFLLNTFFLLTTQKANESLTFSRKQHKGLAPGRKQGEVEEQGKKAYLTGEGRGFKCSRAMLAGHISTDEGEWRSQRQRLVKASKASESPWEEQPLFNSDLSQHAAA
jgi:hypothetical protein